MNIEIAICTWNRCEMLKATLKRLASIDVPSGTNLNAIVVDNNSTDETQYIIQSFQSDLEIVSVFEKQQGHTHARNAAINAATGNILIWIDDDVLVDKHWLDSYVQAFKDQPETTFWGGPIHPIFNHDQPKWVDEQWEKIKGCFAHRDLGNSTIPLTASALPYGANFAIRTSTQKLFRFDTDFGRLAGNVMGEDELDLMRRLLTNGRTGYWVPHAKVEHIIDASRTTESYVENYFVGQGKAMVAQNRGWDCTIAQLEKESRHELFCYRMKRYFTGSEVWLSHLIRGALALGQLEAKRTALGKSSH